MKAILSAYILFIATLIPGCAKDGHVVQIIPIPNGDFESWNNQLPAYWKTNSCPPCALPYETYIVQQDASAYLGQFSAKFNYNYVHTAWAENKFYIPGHPVELTAYVKCDLAPTDTVSIKVKLYFSSAVVDSGQWIGTSSILNYMQIRIPITQHHSNVDSALIRIQGGNKNAFPGINTQFWVDNLSFE